MDKLIIKPLFWIMFIFTFLIPATILIVIVKSTNQPIEAGILSVLCLIALFTGGIASWALLITDLISLIKKRHE